jgi:hypothetical protein
MVSAKKHVPIVKKCTFIPLDTIPAPSSVIFGAAAATSVLVLR